MKIMNKTISKQKKHTYLDLNCNKLFRSKPPHINRIRDWITNLDKMNN